MSISLAEIFDALVGDETVATQYAEFVLSYIKTGTCLDLACGTGMISAKLNAQLTMTGLDHDPDMLKQYHHANPDCETILGSLNDLSAIGSYDSIILFGDSLNYVLSLDEVKTLIQQVLEHLNPNGVFLFDMHTENRYTEFKEEYLEEGIVMNHPFQWTILSLEDQLINHHFAFYDNIGQVQTISFDQRVYPLENIISYLRLLNSSFDLYSDFNAGIHPDAEKYLFAVRKDHL